MEIEEEGISFISKDNTCQGILKDATESGRAKTGEESTMSFDMNEVQCCVQPPSLGNMKRGSGQLTRGQSSTASTSFIQTHSNTIQSNTK